MPRHGSRLTRALLRSACATPFLFAATHARGAAGDTSAQLQLYYRAPEGCPTENEFRDRVEARLDRRTRHGAEHETQLVLRVDLHPEASVALVSFQEQDRSVERTVSGGTCEELATAAAVIAAVTLDAWNETPASSAEPGPESSAPVPETQNTELVAPPRPEPPPKPGPPGPAVTRRNTPRESALPRTREQREWELGAGGFVATWPLSAANAGLDVFVRSSTESWSARASALYTRGSKSVGGRSAEFSLFGGRVEGCPLAPRTGSSLRAELCLALEAGALSGRGDETSALLNAGSATVPWFAAVVPARLRLAVGSVIHLEGQGEIGVPLSRPTFVFTRPKETVVRPPYVGFSGRVGLGVTFL